MCEDLDPIAARRELKPSSVDWREKVVINCHTRFADEEPTPAHQFFFTVDPDAEVLMSFVSGQSDVHIFDDASALGRRKQKSAQIDFRWRIF
jgi:hypothetical protein